MKFTSRNSICIFCICFLSMTALLTSCGQDIEKISVEEEALKDLYSKRDSIKWAEEEKRKQENEVAYQEYLANLRRYKETSHPVMFGWFNGWNPEKENYSKLSLLPDSLDIISNWGGISLKPAQIAEMELVRQKGTKVTIGWIVSNIGDGIKFGRENWPEDDYEAIDAYAQAICDSIVKFNYDGFDFDYEPSFVDAQGKHYSGNLVSPYQNSGKEKEIYFVKTMREKLDAIGESRTPKQHMLLQINGSLDWLDPAVVPYVDRFIAQSYNHGSSTTTTGTTKMENWMKKAIDRLGITSDKVIVCESFANVSSASRAQFVIDYGGYAASFNGHIGGIGVFHINEDAFEEDLYANIRKVISIMNPPVNK